MQNILHFPETCRENYENFQIMALPQEVLRKRSAQCAAAAFPFPHGFSIARYYIHKQFI